MPLYQQFANLEARLGKGGWPKNSITGRHEPPDLDWLISKLVSLRGESCSDEQLYAQSIRVHSTWSMLKLQGRRYCLQWHEKKNARKSFTYKSQDKLKRSNSLGAARQLDRLERAAKTTSATRWSTAWAATTHEVKSAIWRRVYPTPQDWRQRFDKDEQTVLVGTGDKYFSMVVPSVEAVLEAILGEKSDLLKLTPQERSRRKKDPAETAALDELRAVYRLVSGKEPTLTTYNGTKRGIHFACFARAVGKRYGFPLIDDHGSRLRTRDRSKRTPKPSRIAVSRPA